MMQSLANSPAMSMAVSSKRLLEGDQKICRFARNRVCQGHGHFCFTSGATATGDRRNCCTCGELRRGSRHQRRIRGGRHVYRSTVVLGPPSVFSASDGGAANPAARRPILACGGSGVRDGRTRLDRGAAAHGQVHQGDGRFRSIVCIDRADRWALERFDAGFPPQARGASVGTRGKE